MARTTTKHLAWSETTGTRRPARTVEAEPQPRGQRRRLARGTGRHWRCPFVSRLRASAAARRQPGEYGGHGVWRRWWRRRLSGADERAGGVVVWPWPVLCKAELESLVAPRSSQLEAVALASIVDRRSFAGFGSAASTGRSRSLLARDPSARLQHVPCLAATRASGGGLAAPTPREPPAAATLVSSRAASG